MKLAELKKSIESHNELVAEIKRLEALLQDSTSALAQLEINCDLNDAAALGEICNLQVRCNLLPRRIDAFNQRLDEAVKALATSCNQFSLNTLALKIRTVREQATPKVKADLGRHIQDKYQLESAVENSSIIISLANISTYPSDDGFIPVEDRANRLLVSYEKACEIEKTLA